MKKLLIAIGVLVVLAVGALLAVPALVPAERIKAEVVAAVKQATGRDLAIDGKVSVSAFPTLSVEVANVALSNPPGYSTKDMIRLGALDVRLKLLPILSGEVVVDSFVLVDPVVTLEVNRQGKPNWQFGDGKAQAPSGSSASSGGPGDIRLGTVAIRNGRLTYVDGATREEVTNLDLDVSLPDLDTPLAAKGALTWRGQPVQLSLDIANPRAVLDGKSSAAALALSSKPVTLSFKGEAATAATKGDLDLSVPSVRELVQWTTGKPLEMAGSGLGPFSVKGKLAAGGTRVALSQAAITLDAIAATGDFAVETGGARPAVKGQLTAGVLDLTPYLPPESPAKAGGAQDWSDAPLDASGLRAADADLALSVGGIKIRKLDIGKSALRLTLSGGRLTADLTELALYQGAGKARVVVDGSQPGLGLDASATLKGLQAAPFLAAAADFDRLEGTAAADLRVSGRGRTERQLIGSLAGNGGVQFVDGAIRGINLAAMVRNVTTAFADTSGSQKTDFAELAGTFTIAEGIVANRDLALKSPLLRVEGAGTVDLPRRALKYRIEPKAVASLEGQGGKGDLGGITVPVIVEGPWSALTYRPDLEAMAKGQAEKALQNVLQPSGDKPALPIQLPSGLFGR